MTITSTPRFELETLAQRPNVHIAAAGPVVLAKFGAATPEDLEVLLEHQLAVARKTGGRITMISLVPIVGNVGRVGDDVRQKSLETMTKLGSSCIGSATVILGTGLGTTLVRMFMTGFTLLSKTPFPQKTFSSVQDSLVWVKQLPQQMPLAQRLTSEMVLEHFSLGVS